MSLLVLQAHTITQRKSLKLKGTKTSVTKNQILVSSGIISLDAVLDGGIPLGTIIFIEEEGYGRNADLISKHFIAEGVACDHSVLIASIELTPEEIVSNLPKPVQEDSDYEFDANEDLKIAWRYKQNPIIDSKPYQTSSSFGHIFDMSIQIPLDELKNIKCWPNKNSPQNSYSALLEHINEIITKGGFSIKIPVEKRNVLRITINHLCSPLWDTTDMDVITFVYKLRMLLRSSYATCLITSKIQIIDNIIKYRLEHLMDTVLYFKPIDLSFCADYNGKLNVGKLASFNTVLYEPLSVDWATKLTRKKLCIEKLHLPPCLESTDEKENNNGTQLPCSSSSALSF